MYNIKTRLLSCTETTHDIQSLAHSSISQDRALVVVSIAKASVMKQICIPNLNS